MDSVSVAEAVLADYKRINEKFVREVYEMNEVITDYMVEQCVFIMWKDYSNRN